MLTGSTTGNIRGIIGTQFYGKTKEQQCRGSPEENLRDPKSEGFNLCGPLMSNRISYQSWAKQPSDRPAGVKAFHLHQYWALTEYLSSETVTGSEFSPFPVGSWSSVTAQVIMQNFQWQPCSSTDLAVTTLAVDAPRWFLALLKPSSPRKWVHLVPFVVSSIHKSHPVPSAQRAPPQHDTATTMLHSRAAIRRLMSCAQFPPHKELCFMAESSVTISSE